MKSPSERRASQPHNFMWLADLITHEFKVSLKFALGLQHIARVELGITGETFDEEQVVRVWWWVKNYLEHGPAPRKPNGTRKLSSNKIQSNQFNRR